MHNPVTAEFEAELAGLLPAAAFREDPAPYLQEPRGLWQGQGFVVAPGNTADVAKLVQACAKERVGIVPYSGGTGLVCGQIKPDGARPVVLSLRRMAKIRAVYPSENVLIAEAGCILADVQQAAAEVERLFALSITSQGSARIGGVLASNAGGVNVLRYGNARAQCLGLEVVLADGKIWHGLSRLRKDNTGYDLRDLMIGSEGTLGVITAAALKLVPAPTGYCTALLSVPSPGAALELLTLAGRHLGETISAFELIARQGLEFLSETGLAFTAPFAKTPDWMVLIEIGLPEGAAPDTAMEKLFGAAFEAELVSDGVIAKSEAQRAALWQIRENIPEANRLIGPVSSHDLSIPLSEIPAFIEAGTRAVAKLGDFRINCFGHIGDGNLHFNVFAPKGRHKKEFASQAADIRRMLYDLTDSFGGSFSAEHGIGRMKTAELQRYGDPQKLMMMRAIKSALDPDGILNPGVVLG